MSFDTDVDVRTQAEYESRWYKISLTSAKKISVTLKLKNPQQNINYDLALFDSCQNNPLVSSKKPGSDEQITYQAAAGEYFIKAYSLYTFGHQLILRVTEDNCAQGPGCDSCLDIADGNEESNACDCDSECSSDRCGGEAYRYKAKCTGGLDGADSFESIFRVLGDSCGNYGYPVSEDVESGISCENIESGCENCICDEDHDETWTGSFTSPCRVKLGFYCISTPECWNDRDGGGTSWCNSLSKCTDGNNGRNCGEDGDCSSGRCDATCAEKLADWQSCDENSDCSSSLCRGGQCRPTIPVCGDGRCEEDRGETFEGCPADCRSNDCDSNTECPQGYYCRFVSGPDTCERIIRPDECSGDELCYNGDVFSCVQDTALNYKKRVLKEKCDAYGKYCDPAVVHTTRQCSTKPDNLAVWIDHAEFGVRVNKARGDKLKLNIYSDNPGLIPFMYDSDAFESDCPIGTIAIEQGVTSCMLEVKSDSPLGESKISAGKDAMVAVIENPYLIVLTDSEQLRKRFPNEGSGVNALLKEAYRNAVNGGIIYDLSWYRDEVGENPFFSYSLYNEKITKPVMLDNSYPLAVSSFIKEKCDPDNDGIGCKSVMVVGDDFVVPYYRRDITIFDGFFWWKNPSIKKLYTDQSYVQRLEKPFAELRDLFKEKKDVTIVIPQQVYANLENLVNGLKDIIKEKYIAEPTIKFSHNLGCNSFGDLKGNTLIIIGGEENNVQKCYPFISSEKGFMSIERNLWDNKNYAIILNASAGTPDTLYILTNLIGKEPNPNWNFGRTIVACLWDGKFGGALPLAKEVVCNMIPFVELASDARDSWKCLFASKDDITESGVVNSIVCSMIYFASSYDLVTWSLALYTAGATGVAGEVIDAPIALLKVTLKNVLPEIAKKVSLKTLIDAKNTIKGGVGLVSGIIQLVIKAPGKVMDIIEGSIHILSNGPQIAKASFDYVVNFDFEVSYKALKGAAEIAKLRIHRYWILSIKGGTKVYRGKALELFGEDEFLKNLELARKGFEEKFEKVGVEVGDMIGQAEDTHGFFDELTSTIVLNIKKIDQRMKEYTVFHEHGHALRHVLLPKPSGIILQELFPGKDINLVKNVLDDFTEFDDPFLWYSKASREAKAAYKLGLENQLYNNIEFWVYVEKLASGGKFNKGKLAKMLAEAEAYGFGEHAQRIKTIIESKIFDKEALDGIFALKSYILSNSGITDVELYKDTLRNVYSLLKS